MLKNIGNSTSTTLAYILDYSNYKKTAIYLA
jgi:hypothetical protein